MAWVYWQDKTDHLWNHVVWSVKSWDEDMCVAELSGYIIVSNSKINFVELKMFDMPLSPVLIHCIYAWRCWRREDLSISKTNPKTLWANVTRIYAISTFQKCQQNNEFVELFFHCYENTTLYWITWQDPSKQLWMKLLSHLFSCLYFESAKK